MKLSRKIRIPLYLLLALMMPLVILLSSTLYFAFNDGFFLDFFEKDHTAERLGLDDSGMKQVVENLTGYMSGSEASMDIQIPIHGEMKRFYNDRELSHMVDVRNLMALGSRTRSVLLFFSLLIFVLLKRFGGAEVFWQGVLASTLGALALAGLLRVVAVNDFSAAFYRFHEIFFTNTLWILDPETDRLIQMLPELFFFSMTARILIFSGLAVLFMGIAAAWGIKRYRVVGYKEVTHADSL